MNQKQVQGWLFIFILIGSILAFSSNSYAPVFSIYNEDWNGTSEFRMSLENQLNYTTSRILVSPLILQSNDNISIMIIIGSERKYTDGEIAAYVSFVERGGSLIIFDDFGPARVIPDRFGISYFKGIIKETHPSLYVNRPSQLFILDILIRQVFPSLNLAPLLGSDVAGLFDATGLLSGSTIPLLVSYPSAFLDINDNDQLDRNDFQIGPGIPIALHKSIGQNNGTITVIGDSSIPLNQYWKKEITIVNPETYVRDVVTISNWFWVMMLVGFIAGVRNTTNVVFDESHQAISFTSFAGILNLIAGTWVGLVNTATISLIVLLFSVLISSIKFRSGVRSVVSRRNRDDRRADNQPVQFISRPNLAERSISEQYILYQIMGDSFLHVANSNLLKQLQDTGKADKFIEEIIFDYGKDLRSPASFEELLNLHKKMQNYLDENKNKLL